MRAHCRFGWASGSWIVWAWRSCAVFLFVIVFCVFAFSLLFQEAMTFAGNGDLRGLVSGISTAKKNVECSSRRDYALGLSSLRKLQGDWAI